jgi:hypothetical protein
MLWNREQLILDFAYGNNYEVLFHNITQVKCLVTFHCLTLQVGVAVTFRKYQIRIPATLPGILSSKCSIPQTLHENFGTLKLATTATKSLPTYCPLPPEPLNNLRIDHPVTKNKPYA